MILRVYTVFLLALITLKQMRSLITRSVCPVCGSEQIALVLKCKDYTVSEEIFEIWGCAVCKLRFTQHVPGQEAIGPYYQSDTYISHSDTEKGLINKLYKLARNYTLGWKVAVVHRYVQNEGKRGRLLDIGAGTGTFVHHATKSNWDALGLEPDAGARKISSEKYHTELAEAEKLFTLPSNQFDVVTMWHVLEHVHQLHEYMEEIRRVLKANGTALIALPNYTSRDAAYYGADWAAYDVPRHLYHFAPLAVKSLVLQHNMKVESIKPMWLDAFYIAMLSEEYKNGKNNLSSAVMNGLKSNWAAWRKNDQCSSLVYVIRKQYET
jgi:ubiquinone/menaquinone biosynthesis C-methylase UbiE